MWSPNGDELLYRNGDEMIAVTVTTARTLEVGPSHVLFEAPYFGSLSDHAHYDVFPDGERFIMMTRTDNEAVPTQINVVLDWMQELDRSTSEN